MAETEILPEWAARYVQEHLAEHMHIVNVLPIDKGAYNGAFLLNTSKGAVLVQKGRIGEVNHWFMPLPGQHFSFRCQECKEAMEFVDPDVPRVAYCSRCGHQYYLVIQDGALAMVEETGRKPKGHAVDGYTLYKRRRDGKDEYFFAKTEPASGRPAPVPDGYEVKTNPRTGVPMLVKKGQPKQETYYAYRGDVHDVIDVEGIGPRHAKRLKAAGVRTTARLLYEDPAQLAARIEVPERTVRQWQAMAELMIVSGIGKQYAEVLARAGIGGIQELKDGDPEQLAQRVNKYLDTLEVNVLGQPVTPRRIRSLRRAAAGMRRVRTRIPEE